MTRLPLALTVSVALAATSLLGCRHDDPATAGPTTAPSGEVSMGRALRSGQLQGLPPLVQQAALDDLGNASITGTRTQSSEAGLLYRVNYIENGAAKQATYNDQGKRINPAGSSSAAPQDVQPGPGLDLRDANTGEPMRGAATPATTGPIRQRNAGGY